MNRRRHTGKPKISPATFYAGLHPCLCRPLLRRSALLRPFFTRSEQPYQNLPPPPLIPAPPRRRFAWFLAGVLLAAIATGGWWLYEHRLPKVNPKDGLTYLWIPLESHHGLRHRQSDCRADEKPPHEVTLTRGFYLSQTEATVEAYQRFAAATQTAMPPEPKWGSFSMNPGWQSVKNPISISPGSRPTLTANGLAAACPPKPNGSTPRAPERMPPLWRPRRHGWFADNAGASHIDSLDILNNDGKNYESRLMANQNTFHPWLSRRQTVSGSTI